jgi:transcriptional regulator with XRE-family HTH domain
MENLIAYLKQNGISQSRFAETVGVTQSSLSKMCSGLILPSLETAVRIAKETGGKVPVEVWVNTPTPDQMPAPTTAEDAA